jgi:hypothetical protein
MQPDPLRGFQEALAALDQAADVMAGQLRSVRAARSIDRVTVVASLDDLLQAARAVQKAFAGLAEAAGEPAPEWGTREELDDVAARLAARAEKRAANRWRLRLQEVAAALAAGRVISRRSRRVIASLDDLRSAAAAELSGVAEGDRPLVLPGPPDGSWLDWVFGQPGDELEALLAPLHCPTPELYRFLLDLHPDDWQANPATSNPAPPGASPNPCTSLSAASGRAPHSPGASARLGRRTSPPARAVRRARAAAGAWP